MHDVFNVNALSLLHVGSRNADDLISNGYVSPSLPGLSSTSLMKVFLDMMSARTGS